MKSRQSTFERIPNSLIFILLLSVILLKILLYALVKLDVLNLTLGGGSDANYYDSYAKGGISIAVNIWPVLLRYLDNLNLYSRTGISNLLFFIELVFIPILTCVLAGLSFSRNQKHYLYLLLLCAIYPTLFFFSFDIYRDVFMVFSFAIGCLVVKSCLNSQNYIIFLILFALAVTIGFFLLALRPYLGYAFLISLFLWKIKFNKKRVLVLGLLYFLTLFIVNYLGYFEILTEYRAGFEEISSGSTLGLNFSNPLLFVPNLIFSFLGQMLGLYVTNPFAVVLLIIETIPFFFMLLYVFKNIKLADSFVRFLIIFSIIYASVWLIGNDNLGTAVRLRLYNYLAVYIGFFYILRLKTRSLNNSQVSSQ